MLSTFIEPKTEDQRTVRECKRVVGDRTAHLFSNIERLLERRPELAELSQLYNNNN